MIDESEVKIRKFKMLADKATNETQLLDLCKKYLKYKGIDVDHAAARDLLSSQIAPPKIEKLWTGMPDLLTVHGTYKIDDVRVFSATDEKQMQTYARKCVSENIMHELVRNDIIKFESYREYSCLQTIVRGKLLVYKEK